MLEVSISCPVSLQNKFLYINDVTRKTILLLVAEGVSNIQNGVRFLRRDAEY